MRVNSRPGRTCLCAPQLYWQSVALCQEPRAGPRLRLDWVLLSEPALMGISCVTTETVLVLLAKAVNWHRPQPLHLDSLCLELRLKYQTAEE